MPFPKGPPPTCDCRNEEDDCESQSDKRTGLQRGLQWQPVFDTHCRMPNDRDKQLAANRLSMPNDSAASLLHRLVRGAVGFPLTLSLGHRRERFRPVVKSGRIKVSAIRPNEGVNLWV